MQRFLVLFSGIFFSILFVGYFTNYSASAASVYDGAYHTVDNLVIRTPPGAGECESRDFTTSIDSLFQIEVMDTSPPNDYSGTFGMTQGVIDSWNNKKSWSISRTDYYIYVFWSTDENNPLEMQWYENSTKTQSGVNRIAFAQGWSSNLSRACDRMTLGGTSDYDVTQRGGRANFYFTGNPNYPPNYAGEPVRDSWQPPADKENLRPEYTYQVSPSGKLSINYTKNLNTFLTGTSFFVLEKMNDNWQGVDENVYSNLAYTPAGSLSGDSKFAVLNQAENIDMIVPGIGYYMIRIDHNQQLDSPPWSEDAEEKYNIEQVYLQFYWDGSSVVVGDNIGGCDGICNPEKGTANNKILTALRKFNVDDHGLQAIIFIPLEFFATIPSITQTCTPLNIPFIDRNMSVPCIREPLNQAQPAMVFLITVFINGIVTLGVAFALFRHIKNLHDPKKDEIEVLKL